jgi:hypothetical protein
MAHTSQTQADGRHRCGFWVRATGTDDELPPKQAQVEGMMYCPKCDRKLERSEFHSAKGEVQAYWMCGSCGCRVFEEDDEFEWPEWLKDAPRDAG